jgi:ribosome-binding factor A
MRKTRRTSRVGQSVRDALVEVFRFDLKDVALGLSSIVDVEVSPDLHHARVFISGLKEDETRKLIDDLQARQGRIRSALGKRIRLRYTPELEFRFDDTSARAGRIESLLHDINQQPKADDYDDSDDLT